MKSTTKKITTVIIDNRYWVRYSLRIGLEDENITCIGQGSTEAEAIDLCSNLQPDILVIDMFAPDTININSIEKIHEVAPQTQVIVFSAFAEKEKINEILEKGAVAFVSKSDSINDLRSTIIQSQRRM